MKRILIIHTGGTFGMVPKDPSPTLAPSQVQKRITQNVPALEKIANIEFQALFNLDSANINPTHWQGLAELISKKMAMFDGFVVIHGTDSMTYSAAALSFMLQNLPKPVVLTGSQRPLAEIRSDARMNLINAVELASRDIPEVSLFLGTQLLRGNRAVKISSIDYGAFASPNFPPLAEVGLDITVNKACLRPHGPFRLFSAMSDAVLAIPFFPGLSPTYLADLAQSSLRAVVIQAMGMGNVSTREKSLVPLVAQLNDCGKIVAVTSQSQHGFVDLERYENGQLIAQAGAIGAYDMTTEATIVKLMHLLGRFPDDIQAVKQHLPVPIAGEISEKVKGKR